MSTYTYKRNINRYIERYRQQYNSETLIPPPYINGYIIQTNINKDTLALNYTLNQMNLPNIHITFHPKATESTFFPSAHGTFSRIDHILGHKTSLNKIKQTESIPSIFS